MILKRAGSYGRSLCRGGKVVEPAYENRHLTIETEIEDTVLTVNRELLVTALVNLMDNARKASEEGQQVEVTGKIVDNMACNIPKDKTDIGEAESADDRNARGHMKYA